MKKNLLLVFLWSVFIHCNAQEFVPHYYTQLDTSYTYIQQNVLFTGDLNNDSLDDFITISDKIIYENTGDYRFKKHSAMTSRTLPDLSINDRYYALFDFNGDHYNDFIYGLADTIFFLTNNKDFTFSVAQTIKLPNNAVSPSPYIFATDLNNDGKKDILILAGKFFYSLATDSGFADPVLLKLRSPLQLFVYDNKNRIKVEDFNNDNKADLFKEGTVLSVSGDSLLPIIPAYFPPGTAGVDTVYNKSDIENLDGNHIADRLFTYTLRGKDFVKILFDDGSSRIIDSSRLYTNAQYSHNVNDLYITEDMNHDGLMDFIFCERNDNNFVKGGLRVYLNNGDKTFRKLIVDNYYTLTQSISDLLPGYFNKDSLKDFYYKNSIFTFGDPYFHQNFILQDFYKFNLIGLEDVDGDGLKDGIFFLMEGNDTKIAWAKNTGNFTFAPLQWLIDKIPFYSSFNSGDAKFADMNNDGLTDIVYSTDNSLMLFSRHPDGTYSTQLLDALPSNFWAGTVNIQDLNNDGKKDIIWSIHGLVTYQGIPNTDEGLVYYLKNNGGNSFSGRTHIIDTLPSFRSIAFNDINHDGLIDIYFPRDVNYDDVSWYKNLGNFNFASRAQYDIVRFTFAFTDLNGDGQLEYINNPFSSSYKYYICTSAHNSTGGCIDRELYYNSNYYGFPDMFADINNDHQQDLLFENINYGYVLYTRHNKGQLTFDTVITPSDTLYNTHNHNYQLFSAIDIDNDGDNDLVLKDLYDVNYANSTLSRSHYFMILENKTYNPVWVSNNFLQEGFFHVFPNPVKGIVNLEWEVPDVHEELRLSISDILGNRIESFSVENSLHSMQYNTDHLSHGMYMVTLTSSNKLLGTAKLVVQ